MTFNIRDSHLRRMPFLCSVSAALSLLAQPNVATLASTGALYDVIELGQNFFPQAINDSGQVVGFTPDPYVGCYCSFYSQGVLSRVDGMRVGNAINALGQVVGVSSDGSYTPRATLWDSRTGNLSDLGFSGSGVGINDSGMMLIEGNDGSVYLYDGQTTVTLGNCGTIARYGVLGIRINNSGQVAGGNPGGPFLYSNGSSQMLGNFGGESAAFYDINNLGHCVGRLSFSNPTPASLGLLYADGQMSSLGGLGVMQGENGHYDVFCEAYGINDSEQIVGRSDTRQAYLLPHPTYTECVYEAAVLWQDQQLFNLNDLIAHDSGWHLCEALRVNNSGQIIGRGYYNGVSSSFLLAPQFFWTPGAGTFQDPAKWPGQAFAPRACHTVVFSDSDYPTNDSVDFEDDAHTKSVMVRNSQTSFHLNDHQYQVDDSVVIGENASDCGVLTVFNGTLATNKLVVGAVPTPDGSGTNGGAGALGVSYGAFVHIAQTMQVGRNGHVSMDPNVTTTMVVGPRNDGLGHDPQDIPHQGSSLMVVTGKGRPVTALPEDQGRQPAGVVRLSGGYLSADQIMLLGGSIGGTPEDRGTLKGSGYIANEDQPVRKNFVSNSGYIAVQGDYLPAPAGTSASHQSQLWINGDYHQGSDGLLELTVGPDNKVGVGWQTYTSPAKIPVTISGNAHFDGTIQVNLAQQANGAAYVPDIGDAFSLIRYGAVSNRFVKLKGSIIPGVDDRFLGLRYDSGTDTGGIAYHELQLYTLETPRLLNGIVSHLGEGGTPIRSDLVLSTHGWTSNVNPGSPMGNLGLAIAQRVSPQGCDAAVFNWHEFSLGNGLLGQSGQPEEAASRAIDIGEALANWMYEKGYSYDNVHILAHSAGSCLADGVVRKMKQGGLCNTAHQTVFDAFDPNSAFGSDSRIHTEGQSLPTVGMYANFAEHYFDSRDRPPLLYGTNHSFAQAFNVDVTRCDPEYTYYQLQELLPTYPLMVQSVLAHYHAWPVQWYQDTVLNLSSGQGLGFPLAAECSGQIVGYRGVYQPNYRIVLNGDGTAMLAQLSNSQKIDFAPENTIASDTGTVTFNSDGSVEMATGSPVMITRLLSSTSLANMLSFDFVAEAATPSLLSVYFNGVLIGEDALFCTSEEMQSLSEGLIFSEDFSLQGEYAPGYYTLMFRLDPLGNQQSAIQILGASIYELTAVTIPEPSAIMLLGIALFCFLARSASSRIRT